jgi:hypothetical protein
MEGAVGTDEVAVALCRRQRGLLCNGGLHLLGQSRRRLQRELAHQLQLDGAAQEMRLARRRDVDAADQRGVLREHVHEPFFVEAQQRLAHRRLAHSEVVGQFLPRQHGAGCQLQRQDGVAQLLQHLGRGQAGAVESDLREGTHRGWIVALTY